MSSMTILRNADGEQLGYVVTRQKLNQDERDALAAIVVNHLTGLRPMGFEAIRAEVAEGIAQAIEVAGGIRCPTCHELPSSIGSRTYWCANNHMWHGEPFNAAEGAEIARGYTQPAETPGQDS